MRRAHQLRHVLSWKATESCSYHFLLHFKECIKYNLIIKKNIIVSRNWAANLPCAAAEWSRDQFLKSHFLPQRVCIEYTHKHRPWKGSAFPISTSSSSLLQGLLQNYLKSDGRADRWHTLPYCHCLYCLLDYLSFLSHIKYIISLWKYHSSQKTAPSHASHSISGCLVTGLLQAGKQLHHRRVQDDSSTSGISRP